MNICLYCHNETKNPKFCSRSCCGKYLQSDDNFKKRLKNSHSSQPLSIEHKKNISKGLLELYKKKRENLIQTTNFDDLPTSLKKELFIIEKGNKCEECEYEYSDKNGNGPFEVHHIDGNHNNWKIKNLKRLCLNCHWKTEHYRFRGRKHSDNTKNKISENNYRNRGRLL